MTSSDHLAPGTVIADRYGIAALLGEGGMGIVYHAIDHELTEEVALKMLRPELTDSAGALELFRREVKFARRVTHPNVARTYDVGIFGAQRFLTMELVRGQPMLHRMRGDARMPLFEILRLATEIARGLVAAHTVGVVHRDLKPANVLLADMRVVITDFGVATESRTRDNAIAGTPAYMAPEQLLGDELDGRADVYALGVVLYQALTGRIPFVDAAGGLAARVRLEAPDPRALEPSIPTPLAELVLAAMVRSRADWLDSPGILSRLEALRGDVAPPQTVRTPQQQRASSPTPPDSAGPTQLEAQRPSLPDGVVRDLYDRGVAAHAAMKEASAQEAVLLLTRAHDLTPGNPWIMSALGAALTRRANLSFRGDAGDFSLAEDLSLRALAADPSVGETFATIGALRFQQGELRAAISAFHAALARSPNLGEPQSYIGQLLCESGRLREGLVHLDAADAAPIPTRSTAFVRAIALALSGDRAGGEKLIAEEAEARSPTLGRVALRARIALWFGDRSVLPQLSERIAAGAKPGERPGLVAALWGAVARGGASEEEDLEGAVVASNVSVRQRTWLFQIAVEAYALGGSTRRASALLAGLAELPFVDVAWMDRCPLLAPLRDDPRFARAHAVVATRARGLW